jgi:hypothetical protein
LALVFAEFVFTRPPFYDEEDYLRNVYLLHTYGFSIEYLKHHIGAAGPLHSVIHYFLEPLTKLQPPYVRLVNIAFLLAAMYTISLTLKLLGRTSSCSLYVMAIPMTYVIAGLALTEMPAIFFLALGIFFIIKSTQKNNFSAASIFLLIAGGGCISLAIIGRQPYLVVVAAFPILFIDKNINAKSIFSLLITIAVSLAMPLYIFYVWKGLVAPQEASFFNGIAQEGTLYRPDFFILCLAYFSIVFFFIAPHFFLVPNFLIYNKKNIAVIWSIVLVCIIAFNYYYRLIVFLPLFSVVNKILPYSIMNAASILFGSAIITLAIVFVARIIYKYYEHGFSKYYLFYALASVLVAFTCIKITGQFSSRYAAQAIPLLIPLANYFYKPGRFTVYTAAAGVLFGLISFLSYMSLD